MLDFKNHATGIKREDGMPLPGRGFQGGSVLAEHGAAGDNPGLVKMQDDKAPAHGEQQFPGLLMAVRTNQRLGLHRNGQSLDRVRQHFMQIQIGSAPWSSLCCPGQCIELGCGDLFHLSQQSFRVSQGAILTCCTQQPSCLDKNRK